MMVKQFNGKFEECIKFFTTDLLAKESRFQGLFYRIYLTSNSLPKSKLSMYVVKFITS